MGYVERDAYAAACLVARMADKALDRAPVWDDIATFDGRPWRGGVDIISAGYPCQPFSAAGRQRGAADPRHLWPRVLRIVGEVGPEYVFCENVDRHLGKGFDIVCGDLEGLGYRVAAGLFSAAEVGAPHLRRRLFFVAHSGGGRGPDDQLQAGGDLVGVRRPELAHSQCARLERDARGGNNCPRGSSDEPPSGCGWWETEPGLGRMADGVAHRVDRLRAIGNGVVPQVAAKAFLTLLDSLHDGSA